MQLSQKRSIVTFQVHVGCVANVAIILSRISMIKVQHTGFHVIVVDTTPRLSSCHAASSGFDTCI